jgi:hypothetical protein
VRLGRIAEFKKMAESSLSTFIKIPPPYTGKCSVATAFYLDGRVYNKRKL